MRNIDKLTRELKVNANTDKGRTAIISVLRKQFELTKTLQLTNAISKGNINDIPEPILKEIAYNLNLNLNEYFELLDNKEIKEKLGKAIKLLQELYDSI